MTGHGKNKLTFLNLAFSGKHQRKMTIKIKGKIIFKTLPTQIPDGSLLKVEFNDVSYADASSITLGLCEQEIQGYKFGDVMSYEIVCDRPGHDHVVTSVSFTKLVAFFANILYQLSMKIKLILMSKNFTSRKFCESGYSRNFAYFDGI